MKKAFTLIEVIVVITIIGILSGVGIDIFLRIYENYFQSRTQNELQAKTQLAMDQIAARLTYRIKPSVIMAQGVGGASTYTSIETADSNITSTVYRLEWIAYDNDSLRGMALESNSSYIQPGWSGFIDLDNSDKNSLSTPGSFNASTQAIIDALSNHTVDFNSTAFGNNAVIFFPDAPGNVDQFGWYGSVPVRPHRVHANGPSNIDPVSLAFNGLNNEVYETYQLSYTAYALEYNTTSRDLRLYYNYQPWDGENYSNGTSTLFLDNVSNFIFTQIGSMIKIQVCVTSNDSDNNYSLCKERAIF